MKAALMSGTALRGVDAPLRGHEVGTMKYRQGGEWRTRRVTESELREFGRTHRVPDTFTPERVSDLLVELDNEYWPAHPFIKKLPPSPPQIEWDVDNEEWLGTTPSGGLVARINGRLYRDGRLA